MSHNYSVRAGDFFGPILLVGLIAAALGTAVGGISYDSSGRKLKQQFYYNSAFFLSVSGSGDEISSVLNQDDNLRNKKYSLVASRGDLMGHFIRDLHKKEISFKGLSGQRNNLLHSLEDSDLKPSQLTRMIDAGFTLPEETEGSFSDIVDREVLEFIDQDMYWDWIKDKEFKNTVTSLCEGGVDFAAVQPEYPFLLHDLIFSNLIWGAQFIAFLGYFVYSKTEKFNWSNVDWKGAWWPYLGIFVIFPGAVPLIVVLGGLKVVSWLLWEKLPASNNKSDEQEDSDDDDEVEIEKKSGLSTLCSESEVAINKDKRAIERLRKQVNGGEE